MRSVHLILAGATLALPCAAMAQNAPPPADPQPTLSDKLNATDGVIAPPPSGDTEMTQRPPNVGAKTPIIPPQAVTPPGYKPDSPPPEPK